MITGSHQVEAVYTLGQLMVVYANCTMKSW